MKIADKNTKAVDLVREALEKAKQYEDYHCFISMNEARALEKAREIDEKIAKGEKVGRLAGVPYALKDNYLSPEGVTTAAAKMLDNFPAPITATAVKKLEDEGAIMIGRTNLDAYAHGSSTENSYFGPTANAYDKERVAGGSSGGSATRRNEPGRRGPAGLDLAQALPALPRAAAAPGAAPIPRSHPAQNASAAHKNCHSCASAAAPPARDRTAPRSRRSAPATMPRAAA